MYQAGNRPTSRPAEADDAVRPPDPSPKPRRPRWLTLGVIAAGGVIGALARQGLWAAFPHAAGAFDWTTFGINVAGCGLIGVLMVAVAEVWHGHRLAAPFLGVGVLGGFTTFSTYIVEIQKSISVGAPQTGLAYLAATVVAAMVAVSAGAAAARLIIRPYRKDRS
jgi:fluoride exporter